MGQLRVAEGQASLGTRVDWSNWRTGTSLMPRVGRKKSLISHANLETVEYGNNLDSSSVKAIAASSDLLCHFTRLWLTVSRAWAAARRASASDSAATFHHLVHQHESQGKYEFTFQTEMGGQRNGTLLPPFGNFCDALFASISPNKKVLSPPSSFMCSKAKYLLYCKKVLFI